jgi:coenzyme F420-0:L-glutamate ligase/coenzyme F420-1:gamma-L-glutamate ligase
LNAHPDPGSRLVLFGLSGFPMVVRGDSLAALIVNAAVASGMTLQDDDVVVVAQKIVSKAEGRMVELRTIVPGPEAVELGRRCEKDPRLVELILRESASVLRAAPGVLIVEHRRGWVMANAGIDQSNIDGREEPAALLLPEDPDASADALRRSLAVQTGARVGVVINDSFGRAWRLGVAGVALGVSGWPALLDRRGTADLFGRPLAHTMVGHADELAAAASLVQGQAAEGRPVVIVRGARREGPAGTGRDLLRPKEQDLFR